MNDPTDVFSPPESVDVTPSVLIERIEAGDLATCADWLEECDCSAIVHTLSRLSDAQRAAFLSLLPPDDAAGVLGIMPESYVIDAIGELDTTVAASIIQELPSDERADVIRELSDADAEAILSALDTPTEVQTRRLASYDDDVVGSLMLLEYLSFPASVTVRDVLADLEANAEAYRDYDIQYTYIIDDQGRLRGVLPLRNLLLARRTASVRDIMIENPIRVADTTTFDDVRMRFHDHPFLGLPVVDDQDVLVGIVQRDDVARAATEEADDLYRQSQGIVGGEELRSMPLFVRSRRRLAWLSANIVLNIIAASMIALHQDTLEAVIALAIFLPIISDMSGCSGNQAVAVTMRELTLGVVRPDDALRVLFKEATVGLLNGCALGLLIGSVAFLWKGNLFLGLVVGVALALNTILAVCIGGLVPLLMKRLKADPALASGPILTTITDMCGFFIMLTLASLLLAQLTNTAG